MCIHVCIHIIRYVYFLRSFRTRWPSALPSVCPDFWPYQRPPDQKWGKWQGSRAGRGRPPIPSLGPVAAGSRSWSSLAQRSIQRKSQAPHLKTISQNLKNLWWGMWFSLPAGQLPLFCLFCLVETLGRKQQTSLVQRWGHVWQSYLSDCGPSAKLLVSIPTVSPVYIYIVGLLVRLPSY